MPGLFQVRCTYGKFKPEQAGAISYKLGQSSTWSSGPYTLHGIITALYYDRSQRFIVGT